MSRREIFRNITRQQAPSPSSERTPLASYTARGASRTMLSSLGELAEKAARADKGELIVEVDPALIDDSFVVDRLPDDQESEDKELLDAIEEQGQKSPVRLRTHPNDPARYQIVFGHRRVRVARKLARPVLAVVEAMNDVEHVIAQGQENSAREDLSFIERAMFAKQLQDRGFDRETIQAALSADAPMITRMLSVSSRVPVSVVAAIGRAKGVGRDRWQEFAQMIEQPSNHATIERLLVTPGFDSSTSDVRFEQAYSAMEQVKRPRRAGAQKPTSIRWQPGDRKISADVIESSRAVELRFKNKDAGAFGRFLVRNLDELYDQFLKQGNEAEK